MTRDVIEQGFDWIGMGIGGPTYRIHCMPLNFTLREPLNVCPATCVVGGLFVNASVPGNGTPRGTCQMEDMHCPPAPKRSPCHSYAENAGACVFEGLCGVYSR